ncbi:MAG TPA: AAA family ATPase, partial [Saprospiraceae bacterium]|nr:AAA family ATPase [Saprospiraceae bacterium]
SLMAKWKNEKAIIDRINILREEIEDLERKAQKAERESDFETVAKIRYGELQKKQQELKDSEHELNQLPEGSRFTAQQVTASDIADVVSKWTGIPVSKLQQSEKDKLLNLEKAIGKMLVGQDEAVAAVSDAVRRNRAGLSDGKRPVGSFIFLGPTGVGKTELTKALADVLFDDKDAIIRIDMSEYMEKHTVSRLIGAPPGYVGYEEGGQLTEAVRHRPYSIVLLDEIEKAHADVFNVLLQVLDDGHLTDGKGRQVNFKNTIIIMTSNLGSNIILENFEDLGAIDANKRGEVLETTKLEVFELLKQTMRPEFLNRVDETIMFLPLTKDEIERILFIQMSSINKLLKTQELSIQLEPSAVNLLVGLGYDPQFGARPLKRVLQRELINELSKSILSGEFVAGDVIVAEGNNTGLTFHKKTAEKAILSEKTEAQP